MTLHNREIITYSTKNHLWTVRDVTGMNLVTQDLYILVTRQDRL